MKNTVYKLSEPFDLSQYKNTRFMYNPTTKEIILGSEHDTVENGSHAQMYYDAKQNTNTGYDDYNIKGWIGFGGKKYKKGVIHFAPNIRPDQYEKIDQAFTLIERLKKHGFDDNTWIRGLVRFDEFKIKDMYDKVANWQDDVKPYTEQVKDFVNCSFVKDKVYKIAEGVYTSDKIKAQYHNSDLKPYFLLIDSPFYSNGKLTESFENLSKKGFNGIIQGKTYRVFDESQQVKEADAQKDNQIREKVRSIFFSLIKSIKNNPNVGSIVGTENGYGYFINLTQGLKYFYPDYNSKPLYVLIKSADKNYCSYGKKDDYNIIIMNILSEKQMMEMAKSQEKGKKSIINQYIKKTIVPVLTDEANSFIHEFIHAIDDVRLKNYRGRKESQLNLNNTEYLSDPLEFNAWFQSNMYDFDKDSDNEPALKKDWKLFYSYVLDCLPFVKEYNEKYRRKFDVRLWKYWNEFIKEKKQVNEALKNEGGYFITNKPADIINLCINKPKEYRIVYDSNINLYMICDANEGIHQEMLEKAYRSGLYYKMDNFIEQLGAFQNYIETGQSGGWDADDNEIDQYLFYIIFDPNNNWQLGDDEYDNVKEFSFGKFFTRGCELEETPLYNEALKHNQLNEAYVKGERGNAYYTKSDDVFLSLIKSVFINKNLPVRVAYDLTNHLYMFGNAFDYIHTDLIKTIKYQSNEYDESDDVQSHCALFQVVPTDEVKKYTMSDGYNSGWILPFDNFFVISRNKEHNATMEVPAFEEHKWEWTGIEYYEYKKSQEQDKVVNESAELNDNFWKWFGNSKVVDENGNPLVVYHGWNKDFKEFILQDKDVKGVKCAFFSSDADTAASYSEFGNIKDFYLRIENPLIYDANYSQYYIGKDSNHIMVALNKAKNGNYDGCIIKNIRDDSYQEYEDGFEMPYSTTYIVFNPNQIKSVNNNGNWSLSSDNINEVIEEGVNDNYLYHALWKKQFIRCKKDGKLYSHIAYENNGNHTQHRTIKGISMSRDFRVCMKFMENQIREMTDEWDIDPESYFAMRDTGDDGTTHYIDKGSDLSYVVLVFDRNKLKQNHKIIPHSYLAGGMRNSFGDEQEELVVGDIPNFMNYVVDVVEFNNNVNSKTLKSKKDLHENIKSNEESDILIFKNVEIFKNPDKQTIKSLLKDYKELRALWVDGNIYVWNANDPLLHEELEIDKFPFNNTLPFVIRNDGIHNFVIGDYETAKQFPTRQKLYAQKLDKIKQIKSLFPNLSAEQNLIKDLKLNESKEPNLNQNFWSWFGDSVCVDDTGAPKILYHGTSSDFKEFKTDLIFTCDNPNVASEYGSLGAMPVFVKIRKPFIVDAFNQSFDEIYNAEGFKKKYKDLTEEDYQKLFKAYDYFESLEDCKAYYEESKKYNPDDYVNMARAYGQKPRSTNDWAKYAKSKGYDGCIIKNVQDTVDISNKTVNEYIVWNSNQVKSIENDGSWSEKDDIYESSNINNNFWAWFGNSVLKDEKGFPIKFYHKTNSKFNTFDLDYSSPILVNGFFFTKDHIKEDFYGKNEMVCYLRMNKPYIIKNMDNIDSVIKFMEDFDIWVGKKPKDLKKYILDACKGYSLRNDGSFDGKSGLRFIVKELGTDILTKRIRDKGYDGLIILNSTGFNNIKFDEYAVFEPNQIKSIDNNGSWSEKK